MINPQNRKILVIAIVCLVLIAVFWAFIYFPAANKLRAIKAELNSVKREISDIESHSGKKAGDIARMVESLQGDFQRINQKFPAEEEDALKLLSSAANKLKIEIAYMRPQQKRVVLNGQGSPILIDGSQCCSIPISMEIAGLYKDIGEYLKWLRTDFPPLVKVEDISMARDESRIPQLKVSMELVLYILGED